MDIPPPAFLVTPELQARYALMVLAEYGDYLRLADPETFSFYAKRASQAVSPKS